jgi:hypothetical protein
MEASLELERDFLPKLATHGWLLSPRGDADQPEQLHALYGAGGIAAVDSYFIEQLDADTCRAIVDEITKAGVFKPWGPTFLKALAALERGDHELAIPVWLAALEFACARELRLKRVYNKPEEAKRKVVEQELMRLSPVYEPLVVAWLEVLLGFSGDRGRTAAIFHRHAVMHGERPLIGTRKDALQCLLALEVLRYLIDARAHHKADRLRANRGEFK